MRFLAQWFILGFVISGIFNVLYVVFVAIKGQKGAEEGVGAVTFSLSWFLLYTLVGACVITLVASLIKALQK
jgi:hypothetical protein